MTAKTSTRRYVPHHLASTIDRVESGVASSTSRLPCAAPQPMLSAPWH